MSRQLPIRTVKTCAWLWRWLFALLAMPLWAGSCKPLSPPADFAQPFVRGLSQPRGMAFDASGALYIAETGALLPSAPGEKPDGINHSGRVLRISTAGQLETVLDQLPYTHSEASGDVGVSDVALFGETLYILTGEGYDDKLSRTILRVVPGQPPQIVAGFLNFAIGMSSSTEQVIGSITSNPFALAVAADGETLFVSDGATGRILAVTHDGKIRVFAEVPGMPPLTGLSFGPDGRLYVGMFSTLPHSPGSGEVWAVTPDGEASMVVPGLTMPIDVGFDTAGTLYVLEFGDGMEVSRPYAPNRGRLLRIEAGDTHRVVLDSLDYPTSFAFSPTGDLYVTTGGAFREAGEGAILKVPCTALPSPCTPQP